MKPIRISPAHKGGLHKALNVPEGRKIPLVRIEAAKKSPDAHLRSMANFALNARGFGHSK